MLKKIISVFTVLVLGFVFTACGSNQTSNDENKTTIRYGKAAGPYTVLFGTAILAPFSISFKSLCVWEKIPAGTVGIAPKATNSPFCDSLKLFIYAVCCSTLTSISPSFNAK